MPLAHASSLALPCQTSEWWENGPAVLENIWLPNHSQLYSPLTTCKPSWTNIQNVRVSQKVPSNTLKLQVMSQKCRASASLAISKVPIFLLQSSHLRITIKTQNSLQLMVSSCYSWKDVSLAQDRSATKAAACCHLGSSRRRYLPLETLLA